MMVNYFRGFILGLTILAVTACSKNKEETYIAQEVEQLYNVAHDFADRKRWRIAAIAFDEVERQHPYSVWARRAQLMSAYSHYMSRNYDDAILASDRFLQLHPGNVSAPYAYYLKAVSYYNQIVDVGRDQDLTFKARDALVELIRRYPESTYSQDARLKLDLTNDHLAGKEMNVGRYYLHREEYLAALGRFQHVANKYETSSHVPEALHRLVEVDLALGLVVDAEKNAAVLGTNYPGSKWYERSYKLLTKNRQDR
jgi:outer membrane protein assembly factor BamD